MPARGDRAAAVMVGDDAGFAAAAIDRIPAR